MNLIEARLHTIKLFRSLNLAANMRSMDVNKNNTTWTMCRCVKDFNNNETICLIAGFPTGYDEIWVIGDTHMLAQLRSSLKSLKQADSFNSKRDSAASSLLYILTHFEVLFGTFHHSRSFTTQIKGGLNHLLSTKWKLPNYIYIVFSNEQIQESEILGDEIYSVLNRLFTALAELSLREKCCCPEKHVDISHQHSSSSEQSQKQRKNSRKETSKIKDGPLTGQYNE